MSDEPVIGGETNETDGGGETDEAEGRAQTADPDGELAERLREALLAADPDLRADELAGGAADEVRERYAAARAARTLAVSAGAPGRLSPAPLGALAKIRAGLARLDD